MCVCVCVCAELCVECCQARQEVERQGRFSYDDSKVYVRKVTREECCQINNIATRDAAAINNTTAKDTVSDFKVLTNDVVLLLDTAEDENNDHDRKDEDFICNTTAQVNVVDVDNICRKM